MEAVIQVSNFFVNVVGRDPHGVSPVKAIESDPHTSLKASISTIRTWKQEGVTTIKLKTDYDIWAAEKVFVRFRDLGLDVIPVNYVLLRPKQPIRRLLSELDCLYRCGWTYLPFLLPSQDKDLWEQGMNQLIPLLSPLRSLAHFEDKVVKTCWDQGIFYFGSTRGVSGVRSSMRVLETENLHLMRTGLQRASGEFKRGVDLCEMAVQRILERREKQLHSIEHMLVRSQKA